MKKLVAGFLAGAITFGAVGAYAVGGNLIEVFYNVKNIKINKVSQMPDQQPFTYKGTTYVPLRYISEKLGYNVKWEGSTQTIYIGEMEETTAAYPGRDIEHMNYQEGYYRHYFEYVYDSSEKIKDNVGNEYSNYIKFFIGDSWSSEDQWSLLEFPLNGQYKTFKAIAGLTNDYKDSPGSIVLEIYIDGEKTYSKTFIPGDFPEEINLNIKNVNKITFRVSSPRGDVDNELGLFDARFIK
ncbi:NPCBM/NEW2 domain-containing protein [Thermolongibacillus altinsuensis]|uniref:NPCBM/NEW2 domain-containing protein n=1 Tax=Thermolongibacillus altinsuensis TaxID=575256 RepID=A0A4R1QS21_9BACL|nr:stalk domain-containing protein [Thermolongibacillus altinsuensis]TCL52850.1 NPCBM/NEW2 domain-containing protein [Thermolongibacillus altinsuensis]